MKELSRPASVLLGTAYFVAGATLVFYGISLMTGAGKFTYGKS